jgi:hypothetical protein
MVLEVLEDLSVEPDLVMLTHAHADHAGGMDSLVERFRERAAFAALDLDLEAVASSKVRKAAQGQETAAALRAIRLAPQSWDLAAAPRSIGRGTLTVLHPSDVRLAQLLDLSSIGPNRFSTAVIVDWGERSVLLGADLERPEWVSLVDAARLDSCNPVKVPHHGSPGAFDKIWAGDRATRPENAQRRMLVAPFNRRPKLPDLDHAKGLPGLLAQVDEVNLTSLPFETDPVMTGGCRLGELRAARDQAKTASLPLPAAFDAPSPRQTDPSEDDSWLLAELSSDGRCVVRGGASRVDIVS